MAKVSPTALFSNSLGDYSVYKQRGVDKLIIRFKGGPNANMLKTSPKFQQVRAQQSEMRAMGKLSHYLAQGCKGVKHLADHNFAANFSKIGRLIQKLDTECEPGKAAMMFSTHGSIINGFNFNKENPFSSVVTPLPQLTIQRSELRATVTFPDLYPGINLKSKWPFPLCRFTITLGLIPDILHNGKEYAPALQHFRQTSSTESGPWLAAESKINSFSLEARINKNAHFDESITLLLSVGIEFGRNITESVVEPVKYAGSAMILGVG